MLTYTEHKAKLNLSAGYNKPNTYGEEGTDHINISLQSVSKLGRILDPGYCARIDYPHIGSFKSILALGYWLKSPDLDDSIRKLKGHKLKQYVKEHDLNNRRVKNYTAIIANALWIRINNTPDVVESIRKLPDDIEFLSYYIHKTSGLRITTSYAQTVVAIAKEIVSAIKDNREPDLDQFANDRKRTGMGYLEAVLPNILK